MEQVLREADSLQHLRSSSSLKSNQPEPSYRQKMKIMTDRHGIRNAVKTSRNQQGFTDDQKRSTRQVKSLEYNQIVRYARQPKLPDCFTDRYKLSLGSGNEFSSRFSWANKANSADRFVGCIYDSDSSRFECCSLPNCNAVSG